MRGLDEYSQKYLLQWEGVATVRRRARFRLTKDSFPCDLFPAGAFPIVDHPAVQALGKDAIRVALAWAAYQMQEDIAYIEARVVANLCNSFAMRKICFDVPESARQVALTIGTDEVYHAYVAREFIADAERLSGINALPHDGSETTIANALAYVRSATPPDLLGEAEIMVLCFAENFVTEGLFGTMKSAEEDSVFRVIIREHLMDEGRHQLFFQNLMRHMWHEIDDDARTALGALVPGFLDKFLMDGGSVWGRWTSILKGLGFDESKAKEIILETFGAMGALGPKHQSRHVGQCMNLLRVSEMLDHPPTRELLIKTEWSAP